MVRVSTGVMLMMKPVWEMCAGGFFNQNTVIVSHEMSVKSLETLSTLAMFGCWLLYMRSGFANFGKNNRDTESYSR